MPHAFEDDLSNRCEERRIPIYATMDLTYLCNLDCVHCYNSPKDESELSFKEVVSVIDQLAKAGSLFLKLGGGEPLIRKDFFDIAFHARRRGFALTLLTNGTLITKESAKKIAQLYPNLVQVTLYGASESDYAKVTGHPEAFHKALRGVRLLNERKIPLFVNTLTFKYFSLKKLLWMEKFCKGLGLQLEVFSDFHPGTNGDLTPLKYGVPRAQFEKVLRRYPKLRSRSRARPEDSRVCHRLRSNIYIDPYGNVGSCSSLASKESSRERPVMDIWRNSRLLRRQRELKFSELTKCLRCKSLPYCIPCPAINYVASGDLTEPVKAVCKRAHMMREVCGKISAGES